MTDTERAEKIVEHIDAICVLCGSPSIKDIVAHAGLEGLPVEVKNTVIRDSVNNAVAVVGMAMAAGVEKTYDAVNSTDFKSVLEKAYPDKKKGD